jgi:DNA replication protein DnaC
MAEAFRVCMSVDQQEALDIVLDRHNICIMGPAGTGKTYLIHHMHRTLRSRGIRVAITASTGVAANNVGLGATTLHK